MTLEIMYAETFNGEESNFDVEIFLERYFWNFGSGLKLFSNYTMFFTE